MRRECLRKEEKKFKHVFFVVWVLYLLSWRKRLNRLRMDQYNRKCWRRLPNGFSRFFRFYQLQRCSFTQEEAKNLQNRSFFQVRVLLVIMMGRNPLKWKLRTLGYLLLGIFGFYMIFVFKKNHHYVSEFTIKNTKAENVWEFVADFSNMMKLNPTIEEFDIINESGNYDHWKYSVKYKEHLHHIPAIKNTGHGHFSIRQDGNYYKITSNHQTCFFDGLNCVNSISEFTFSESGDDTKCVEMIKYECPLAFSQFCYREVAYQRREIMTRLTRHFSLINVVHTEKDE